VVLHFGLRKLTLWDQKFREIQKEDTSKTESIILSNDVKAAPGRCGPILYPHGQIGTGKQDGGCLVRLTVKRGGMPREDWNDFFLIREKTG
jgi:hypothetical protein